MAGTGSTAEGWLDARPAERAEAAASALGREEFASWCANVLIGDIDLGDLTSRPRPDPRWLAAGAWTSWGPPESWTERGMDYWPRVWAARSLLRAWHPLAEPAVLVGLSHDHWRVREMCAKVAAKQELGSAADLCSRAAAHDEKSRVRVAALRVVGVSGEAEHAGGIREPVSPIPARTSPRRLSWRGGSWTSVSSGL